MTSPLLLGIISITREPAFAGMPRTMFSVLVGFGWPHHGQRRTMTDTRQKATEYFAMACDLFPVGRQGPFAGASEPWHFAAVPLEYVFLCAVENRQARKQGAQCGAGTLPFGPHSHTGILEWRLS